MARHSRNTNRSRIRQEVQNMLQVLPGPDKTYKRNYDIFRKWIDEHVEVQGQLDETRPRKYITRENVDLYFSTVVAHRGDIQPDTARRMVPSL